MRKVSGDGLARLRVVFKLKQTSVSMDDVLFRALIHDQGDYQKAVAWVRQCVAQIELLQEANDPSVAVSKAGLSRLVQRMAMAHLLKVELAPKDHGDKAS